MVKSEKFRKKIEEAETLENIKTPFDKYGQKYWYNSLRQNTDFNNKSMSRLNFSDQV